MRSLDTARSERRTTFVIKRQENYVECRRTMDTASVRRRLDSRSKKIGISVDVPLSPSPLSLSLSLVSTASLRFIASTVVVNRPHGVWVISVSDSLPERW